MPEYEPVLSDIRVLDLSEGIPGPFLCKLLAGLGAEVIKVERPGSGDVSRSSPPFLDDGHNGEQGASFLYLNTSKKSVTLNLNTQQGAEILRKLAQGADILVESFSPGHMQQLGMDYAPLEALNPELIYTSITPFGQTGPYRDYRGADIVVQALGAFMDTVGNPDREPLQVGGSAALYTTGYAAFSATMLALYIRDVEGFGQHVDISAMETMTVAQVRASIHQQFGGAYRRKHSPLVAAKDGWVSPGLETGVPEAIWGDLCAIMGVPELADDPNFNTREARRQHQPEVLEIIGKWAATQSKEDMYHTLQGMRSIAGYVATAEDLFTSKQLQERNFFQNVEHPGHGMVMYPGAPFAIGNSIWEQSLAPNLGEHTAEVLGDRLGYSGDELDQLHREGTI